MGYQNGVVGMLGAWLSIVERILYIASDWWDVFVGNPEGNGVWWLDD